ncbi:MAG: alpha/beta fold hydrolase [Bacteroidota bacterium]|nr:alpha/beta fold hydrolase [Bacteroidota bacterium]
MKEKINLYCLPFAGGSSYSYNVFTPHLSSNVNLVPVELPGRGKRSREALLNEADLMADDVFAKIKSNLVSGVPYAIFGHSMGGLLGYLLTRKILENNLPLPLHLFISGRSGPSYNDDREKYYLLPKQEFRDKLKELGGSPKEVLENDDLMDFFEPILRADFQVVETYNHQEEAPFSVPASIMIGDEDKISLEAARLWQKETSQPIKLHSFTGGHFFVFQHLTSICKIISAELDNTL